MVMNRSLTTDLSLIFVFASPISFKFMPVELIKHSQPNYLLLAFSWMLLDKMSHTLSVIGNEFKISISSFGQVKNTFLAKLQRVASFVIPVFSRLIKARNLVFRFEMHRSSILGVFCSMNNVFRDVSLNRGLCDRSIPLKNSGFAFSSFMMILKLHSLILRLSSFKYQKFSFFSQASCIISSITLIRSLVSDPDELISYLAESGLIMLSKCY